MSEYSKWLGRNEIKSDTISKAAVTRFQATLDTSRVEGVPQGFHWCLCLPDIATGDLGLDGHPPKGGFLPPINLPRRMWAASEVLFLNPIEMDTKIERSSTVTNITEKSGKSGDLVFVDVEHVTKSNTIEAIREQQTIVYREATTTRAPLPSCSPETGSHETGSNETGNPIDLSDWDWTRTLTPKTTLLFRYSALTFNSHRIHYDLPYARDEELYPGLVVQGPLMATLLLDHCTRQFGGDALSQFSYKGVSPAFVDQPLHLVGRGEKELELRVIGADNRTVVKASAVRRAD
jgi:3-methylfumaryl-CoA hydratase